MLSFARDLYPQQKITGAGCTKTGFNTVGDIYSCNFMLADGSLTDSADWSVIDNGGQIGALPANAR